MVERVLPLLMTSAISTRGMKGACFTSEEREQQYLEALHYYIENLLLTNSEQKIVFAENSGWDLVRLEKDVVSKYPGVSDRIEWISVDPTQCDISRGKGYNELVMITDAVKRSKIIRVAGAFMKVTGRKVVFNMGHYLRQAETYIFEKHYLYYGDMRDHRFYDILFPHNTKKWNGHVAEEVLFAAPVDYYLSNIGPTFKECNDSTDDLIENVWFRKLKPYRGKKDSKMVLRLDEEPSLGGFQGSVSNAATFSQNNLSFKSQLKRKIRNFARTFTPWLWI